MKKTGKLLGVVLLLALCVATECIAQEVAVRRRGGGGWGAKTQYGLKFNPKTLQTLQGIALSYDKFIPLRQMAYGYLLMLKTSKEVIQVHLGPGWYVEQMKFKVTPGERVLVKGSRVLIGGNYVIIATEVKSPTAYIRLRRDDGFPVWSKQRYDDS